MKPLKADKVAVTACAKSALEMIHGEGFEGLVAVEHNGATSMIFAAGEDVDQARLVSLLTGVRTAITTILAQAGLDEDLQPETHDGYHSRYVPGLPKGRPS